MALSLPECEMIVEELCPALSEGWIQKIRQPRPFTLTFDVRMPGATLGLFVTVEARFARLHLTAKKFENPPTPPPFCQFLRAQVEGGHIEDVTQEPEDRIVYVKIVKGEKRFILVISLTGHHANVLLLDGKRKILRSLKDSWVKVGEQYVPPMKKTPPSPLFSAHMKKGNYHEVLPIDSSSKTTQVDLPTPRSLTDTPPDNGEDSSKQPSILSFKKGGGPLDQFPVSFDLEQRYCQKEEEFQRASLLQQQQTQLRKALKYAKSKVKALGDDLKKVERYKEYARYGELLKSSLSDIQRGQETITTVDYYDPALPTITLPLDPTKDLVWNMEDYFRKYHKFVGAQEHLLPRMKSAKENISQMEDQLAQLEQGTVNPDFSPTPTQPALTPFISGPPKRRFSLAQGYRTYISVDGLSILVGKTAKDNDRLTFKVANPDDLWLHAQGAPGSHVVIRLEKGAAVPHETLKDAATLTLWFSDLRKSGKGEVTYTLRKFVKKAKGQKAGAVHITREKSIFIEVKQDRLDRLKGKTG